MAGRSTSDLSMLTWRKYSFQEPAKDRLLFRDGRSVEPVYCRDHPRPEFIFCQVVLALKLWGTYIPNL